MRHISDNESIEELAKALLRDASTTSDFIQYLLKYIGPDGQQWIKRRFLQLNNPIDGDSAFAASIDARQVEPSQQRALELASLANFFSHRKNLLLDSIPATQAAEILGVSRTTIHERIKSGQLLGIVDNNVMKMPPWQFDAEGPNGAVRGMVEVLSALKCGPLSKISWLSSPNAIFGNKRPIDALKRGELDAVVREAQAVQTV